MVFVVCILTKQVFTILQEVKTLYVEVNCNLEKAIRSDFFAFVMSSAR